MTLTPEEEDNVIAQLLAKTVTGKMRWGLQPPSTVQSNIGNLHYVLRLRRNVYRLTARRDGKQTVNFTIERQAAVAGDLAQLYQAATQVEEA